MYKGIFLFITVFAFGFISAQKAFDEKWLQSPEKSGQEILSVFEIEDIPILDTSDYIGHVILVNQYRDFHLTNADIEELTFYNDLPESVTLVYTKYPLVNGQYKEFYTLLANRLQALFSVIPELNDASIQWKIIRQTQCNNEQQARSMFHGFIIYFDTEEIVATDSLVSFAFDEDYSAFFDIPSDIQQTLDTLSQEEQKVVVEGFLRVNIEKKQHIPAKATPTFISSFKKFNYGNDSTVIKVMDRNKELWDSVLIVVDWTGSMYPYGSQIVDWHNRYYEDSPISYFAVFNDGDNKWEKEIGSTGGIYLVKSDNVDAVIETFYLVGSRGNGGDGPENDIEAILEGMNAYSDFKDIVLIADNSCIRDIELLRNVDQPVHVIICGYDPAWGINDEYVQVAVATGGSIHTIDEDITSIEKVAKEGYFSIGIHDLKVVENYCDFRFFSSVKRRSSVSFVEQNSLDSMRQFKRDFVSLDLSSQSLTEIPKKTFKFKRLTELNLSNNQLTFLPKRVQKFEYLKELNLANNYLTEIQNIGLCPALSLLDLSGNRLEKLPLEFKYLNRLEVLYLQNNQLKDITNMRHPRLMYLDLSGNDIEKIPNSLLSSKKLKYLNLSGNKLTTLPKSLNRLKLLEVLDLSNNQIRELPECIYKMKNLKVLKLNGNPLSDANLNQLRRAMPLLEIEF